MAISKDVTFHGVAVPGAYITAHSPTLQTGNTQITFAVSFAASKANPAYDTQLYACAYDLGGANPVEQAYTYLKTLPEFEGSTDC